MNKPSILMDFSLLKTNHYFRMIFIARMISLLALGMLTVAVPMQIHAMTGSTLQVGVIMALDGIGMFVGLLLGGVLADRFDRRRLILIGRAACAVGFSALALNCFLSNPSLLALYLLSIWSGFFGAIGITSLMASIPVLVGRENLPAAGALGMLTVRIGTVISPMIGGLIIATSDISWNYTAAAIGTFATLIPLTRLPIMPPQSGKPKHPLKALADGFTFLFENKVVGSVVALGTLDSLAKGIRVLFPALAASVYSVGAFELGLMYSAVPLGAIIGAFTSGWVSQLQRPGSLMMATCIASFATLALLSLSSYFVLALIILIVFGYLGSISSLLQYTIVQGHTPNHLLGRVNSLWTAQNVTGDSLGAMGVGVLGKLFVPAMTAFSFASIAAALGFVLSLGFKSLRNANMTDENLSDSTEPDQSNMQQPPSPKTATANT